MSRRVNPFMAEFGWIAQTVTSRAFTTINLAQVTICQRRRLTDEPRLDGNVTTLAHEYRTFKV